MTNRRSEKLKSLKEKYPELENIDWADIFAKNPDILNGIVGNVARSGLVRKGALDRLTGTRQLAMISDSDFSELPFYESLGILASGQDIAELLDLTDEEVHGLESGELPISFELIETAAERLGRHPSYFLEYRIMVILESVELFLRRNPEAATSWYSKAKGGRGVRLR